MNVPRDYKSYTRAQFTDLQLELLDSVKRTNVSIRRLSQNYRFRKNDVLDKAPYPAMHVYRFRIKNCKRQKETLNSDIDDVYNYRKKLKPCFMDDPIF